MANESEKSLTNCPLCGAAAVFAFEVDGYDLQDCGSCGHRFIDIEGDEGHVEQVYNDSYFEGGGAGYSNYLAEETMLRRKGIDYAGKIAAFTGTPGYMLDTGAAAGCVLKGFQDAGWKGIGLEPNNSMVREGRNRFELDLRNGTLEEFESTEMFDLVSAIQVAAHFFDPRKAFENAFSLIKPDGHLLVESWNRDSSMARFLGKNWHEYSPPSVVHWWSRAGLTNFLAGIGFERIAGGRPTKKISGEHARSLLEYKLGKTALLKLIPKRFNFPYPSDDLFWSLFRKGKK